MSLNLQNSVCSHQDLRALILEIQKCAGWFAQTAVKVRVSGDKSYQPPTISAAADDLIKQWHGANPVSQKSLDELIIALKDFEAKAPRINITLAALPPSKLKEGLVAWCRKNIDPNILVDFKFNSTMLGGMVVQYGSHVYDWSFKRQIMAGRAKFAEVLRNV